MIGEVIDNRYQVEALVGRGGMGAVYRATDLVNNRPVALKTLHFFLDGETQMAQTRFHREFRVLERLDHPHIVRAYAHGTHNDRPFLILEYLEGTTLTNVLAKGSPARSNLLDIARQLCDALVYLHANNIVHRDLKPGNVMLLPPLQTPQVKLMDFGLVRHGDLSGQFTQEGMAVGTVAYMAPEQAQGISIDFRADLYALGVILYEMATGRTPFSHDNMATVLVQLLTSSPPPPRALNPNLDEPLEKLILTLMAKEPAQRPTSTEMVSARLAELAHSPAPPAGKSARGVDLIPHVPLIGREAALNELTYIWARTVAERPVDQPGPADPKPNVVLLSGAAGLGKSRLLAEASLLVRLGNNRFVSSHCREYTSLPYQPVVNILETLLPALSASEQAALPADLARILPNAGIRASGESGPSDQAEARRRLFAACWMIFQQLAQGKPLMMAVEDIHLADPTTLELLDYLAQHTGQDSILLVLSYRPEEILPGTPMATFDYQFRRNPAVHRIELEPLKHNQIAHFVQIALGREQLPVGLVDNLQRATGGNPLFVEETLKALAAEGQVAEWLNGQPKGWPKPAGPALQLPLNVLALAERRLQQLEDRDRSILTMAAALGEEFSFVLLQTMAKLDEDDLLDVIDRLLAAQLIEELPLKAREDRYRFTQEALRQALVRSTSQRRIRRLHQRAGEAIEQVYDAGQRRHWPGLAYHFGQAGDNRRALKYSLLAGDAAADVYANAEAIGYYRQALALLKPVEVDDQLLIDLYIGLGRALELNSQFDEALAAYEDLERLAQQQGSPALELAASMALATILSFGSAIFDIVRAEALSEKSLSLARELGDQAAEAKILWGLSNIYSFTNRLETAIEYGEHALALSRRLDLRQQMAFSLNDVARSYFFSGRLNRAQEKAGEARQLWREQKNRPMLADNLALTAQITIYTGRFDQALTYSNEAFEVSQATHNVWGQSYSQFRIGQVYWEYGQPDEAITVTAEAVRLSDVAGFVAGQVATRAALAMIYAELGAAKRGIDLVDQALDIAAAAAQFHRAATLAAKAQIHLLDGNLAEAEMAINQAKTDPNRADLPINFLPVILADGELALRQNDLFRTVAVMDDLMITLRRYGMELYLPDSLYLQGQALLAVGQKGTAHDRLLEARNAAETISSRRMLWPILFALSQVEPDPAESTRLHQQALEVVAYIADNTRADLRASFLKMPQVRAVSRED